MITMAGFRPTRERLKGNLDSQMHYPETCPKGQLARQVRICHHIVENSHVDGRMDGQTDAHTEDQKAYSRLWSGPVLLQVTLTFCPTPREAAVTTLPALVLCGRHLLLGSSALTAQIFAKTNTKKTRLPLYRLYAL